MSKQPRFTNEEKSKLVFLGGPVASDIADLMNYLLTINAGTREQREAAIKGMKRLKEQLAKFEIEPTAQSGRDEGA